MAAALAGVASTITVTNPAPPPKADGAQRPDHHLDDNKTKFRNPWPSFRDMTPSLILSSLWGVLTNMPSVPEDITTAIPSQVPTWGAEPQNAGKIKATWLGHACFLVELPTPPGAVRGPRVMFDPALSNRCFYFQWIGPKRYTSVPCKVEDIPAVDAVVLSHNHYDHTDTNTLQTLHRLHHPHIFAPLNNDAYLSSLGIPPTHTHTLDWWDSRLVELDLPTKTQESEGVKATFRLTCTPSQHTANRSPFDRWRTLWSSWVLEEVKEGGDGGKVYFAGDTGYRTVRKGEEEDAVPVCPAFGEIGERFGGVDLALLPIGAYSPQPLFSNVHASPSDAVRIFKDVRAKRAVAMHWGTWTLTNEPILEPPALLAKETKKAGLEEGAFGVCALGESVVV